MKHIFELNSRVKINESAISKHDTIIESLKKIEKPWGIDISNHIPFPGFGNDFTSIVKLNKYFNSGIKGTIFYRYRNKLEDDSSCDDRMHLEFSSKKIDYEKLITKTFKEYIAFFKPYLASIYNEKVIFEDFEKSRYKNFRNDIIRFPSVFFFDEEFCKKALALSTKQVSTN